MKASLAAYQKKRNFSVTREPGPGGKAGPASGRSYVIQKHAATRLHFDLRLEIDGVLKSWAVPKGIPLEPTQRHLAVEVEDHPLEYAAFEGTIPTGNYGAGTVMIWDRGEYELLGGTPGTAWKAGKLHFVLHGEKLVGEWTLVRTRRDDDKNQWLLLKTGGGIAPLAKKSADRSVVSKRAMEEIAAVGLEAGHKRESSPAPASKRRKTVLKYIAPMKPILVGTLPTDVEEWLYEIKFDGYRAIALKNGASVELWSAAHKPLKFPSIAEAVAGLPCESAILDGEIVAVDANGRSSFQLLQNFRDGHSGTPLCLYLFDLLNLDGTDLCKRTTIERKARLAALLGRAGQDARIRFSADLEGAPTKILDAVRENGLEGIVAKTRTAPYQTGTRSALWQKVKIVAEQDFVIGGYTPPEGSRRYFGALLIGCYRGGKLEYAARVGTGFSADKLAEYFSLFAPLKRGTCPFANLPDKESGRWGQGITAAKMKLCTWIQPTLVCRVRFAEWTADGALRHPVFLGMRDDKRARDVKREPPTG